MTPSIFFQVLLFENLEDQPFEFAEKVWDAEKRRIIPK
jgi:hypothetical protein